VRTEKANFMEEMTEEAEKETNMANLKDQLKGRTVREITEEEQKGGAVK
jgi:hypothetical protein